MKDSAGRRRGRHRATTGKRRGIQSAATGVRVLKAMVGAGSALHLREIAANSGMTASTAYRYLVSYLDAGLVVQDPSSGRYDLGPFAVELGMAALARIDGFAVASEVLSTATRTFDLDGHISVWGSAGPTVVRWKGRPGEIVVRVFEGTVLPLSHSATGRLFAALHTPELVAERAKAEAQTRKQRSTLDQAALRRMLGEIRATTLSFSIVGERRSDIDAVVGPILDHSGAVAFAITLFGPGGSVPTTPAHPQAVAFLELLRAATRRMGGQFV